MAVDDWYQEIKKYNFEKPGFTMSTGHFSQLIWKDSQKLGIAYAQKDGDVYVVANYDPPGNYRGKFKDNVLPLISDN